MGFYLFSSAGWNIACGSWTGDCRRWRMIKHKTDARSTVLTVARLQQRGVTRRKSDKEVPSASFIWPRSTNKHASSCADAASFRVFFSPSRGLKQRKKRGKKKRKCVKRRETIFPFRGVGFKLLKRRKRKPSNGWVETRPRSFASSLTVVV